ncbi:citrate lyase holo-[acyl-carrier protein] synthase [Streptococcus thoraltensis]|uniref:citrate lyase holo-[acyl-carrier protein] synthase n=1 Tax=Streptococcus thoraltensis TaxID=55085 RepID=UPI00036AF967|nr:citrate lyase holo-[acyl-carrier protein] synthase [Streptococcus thoraltensis]MDY4762322.1 citrate lyase holo-[acyl-carrier protein] synthase [Streptococcus thoraltensis]
MSKESVFQGPSVSLDDMLEAREARSFRQQALMEKCPQASLLCATMNIPGPVKTSEKLGQAFDSIIDLIKEKLSDEIIFDKKITPKTGWEYYMMSSLPALELKKALITIEEASDLGRLMDLDVLRKVETGLLSPISRTELNKAPRKCFICSEIAKECGRSRKHSIEQMQAVISKMIDKACVKSH